MPLVIRPCCTTAGMHRDQILFPLHRVLFPLISKGVHERKMPNKHRDGNLQQARDTYIITSSIWMQICGRSVSKTKAELSLVGKLFFSHTGPPTSPCHLQEDLMLVHIWFPSLSSLCSVDLTFLVLANPNLEWASSNSTSSRKPSLLHLPIILFLHS